MNPSGIREMTRNTPEHRGESPETWAGQMKFSQGSQIRAVKSGHAANLSACADLPYTLKSLPMAGIWYVVIIGNNSDFLRLNNC